MELESQRLILFSPTPEYARELLAFTVDNRNHLSPWEPSRPKEHFSLEAVERRILQYTQDANTDQGHFFLIRTKESQVVVGTIHLSGIARGPFQSAYLGYGLAKSSIGQGYMTEAVNRIVDWAFNELGLHRVEANLVPENNASRAVLQRCGFKPEGFSPKYLRIQNVWRDHERYAIINEAWTPARF